MTSYSTSRREWLVDTLETMRIVMPDVLARERELAHTKWFAYRFMTPLAATKHFAAVYRNGFKAYVRIHSDLEESERRHGLGLRIFEKPSGSLTELWQARQRADALGLPYELLVEFGFHFAGRYTWRHAPRPIQLFGSKKSDVAWSLEVSKFMEDRLPLATSRLSDLPQYRNENYRHLPVQVEFRSHLLDHIRHSPKLWSARLAGPCIEKRHLPLLKAIKLVPPDQRRRVISDLRDQLECGSVTPAPVERLPEIAFVPACFGMVAAQEASSSRCAICPFLVKCRSIGNVGSTEMLSRHGSVSPVKDDRDSKRKEGQRRRTQRCRDKKAATLAASAAASS